MGYLFVVQLVSTDHEVLTDIGRRAGPSTVAEFLALENETETIGTVLVLWAGHFQC